ncbi:MAG: hypothetical protein ACEQSC_00110 [Candidatus Nanopelagicaceae bacterium]
MARISGSDAEKLFNRFARDLRIGCSIDSSPSKQLDFVQTLDSLLQKRLQDGTTLGDRPFPDQDEWIADIRVNKLPPALRDSEIAGQWTAFLADRVLAMDNIITINNNAGKAVTIGIDLTINPDPAETGKKLAKIRGLKTNPNSQFNDNRNIPKVRQSLGIDKHIVLVLPGDTERFPSFDVMLDRLHAAANEPAQTKLINLAELPPEQTLDWQKHFEQVQPLNLWRFYSNKFTEKEGRPATGSIRDLQKVAGLAVSDGVQKEKIIAALQQSTWYKEQAASPRPKERDFADRTLGQMIEKLIDAKEMQSANQSITRTLIPEQNYQPTRGELLRWHGAAEAAQALEAKEVSLNLLRQLKSEFQAAGGQEQVPPRDYSNADVVVSEDVRSRMESMVEEYAIRVVPRVEVEVQRDRSEDYDR